MPASSSSTAPDATAPAAPLFVPPAPRPLDRPPGLFAFLRGARENPLETWTVDHFAEPIIAGEGALGRVTVLSDPPAIRHVLVENAANYRKDDLQRRVLAPGLANGLLTAEGEDWPCSAPGTSRVSRPRWRRRPAGWCGAWRGGATAAWWMPRWR
jgi:hypothetical protein